MKGPQISQIHSYACHCLNLNQETGKYTRESAPGYTVCRGVSDVPELTYLLSNARLDGMRPPRRLLSARASKSR